MKFNNVGKNNNFINNCIMNSLSILQNDETNRLESQQIHNIILSIWNDNMDCNITDSESDGNLLTQLNILVKKQKWKQCIELFNRMKREKFTQLDIRVYNLVLSCCGKLGDWEYCIQLLAEINENKNLKKTIQTYNLVLTSLKSAVQNSSSHEP
eukprot:UN24481